MKLTKQQLSAVSATGTLFLHGDAGTGKTTALYHRLSHLLDEGVSADSILVLVAEMNHRQPFHNFVREHNPAPQSELKIANFVGLARELIALFWPIVSENGRFKNPAPEPTFLPYDLAQLMMWRTAESYIEGGAFNAVRMRPQNIVSQLLDTLNRAALNNLPLDTAIERQSMTFVGDDDKRRCFGVAGMVANEFRTHCYENSLLDMSLTIDLFTQLVKDERFLDFFNGRYPHLIIDNIEEQPPAAQFFIEKVMSGSTSTAIAFDNFAGYKRFLGADPKGAQRFQALCPQHLKFEKSFIAPKNMQQMGRMLARNIVGRDDEEAYDQTLPSELILANIGGRYRREMLAKLPAVLQELIDGGVEPSDISIIAPYIDGALLYSLTNGLKSADIPHRTLRRRYAPREEPRVRAWLTWLTLAHPSWNVPPSDYDVNEALTLSIAGLDPARAALITDRLYVHADGELLAADTLSDDVADRIGADLITLYEELRQWLADNSEQHSIDTFLHLLFNDLLAQTRFEPDNNHDLASAAVCSWLMESATRLREAAPALSLEDAGAQGRAFLTAIEQGLVTADPPELGDDTNPDGILITTIYGYLLDKNQSRVQVWLETAAQGWWDIPRQPLSNAFVLSPNWSPDQPWTIQDEFDMRNELLSRIVRGLTARCSDGIIVASSELDRRGVFQDGHLMKALSAGLGVGD